MLAQLIDFLKIAGALLLFIAVWLVTVAVVFRDVNGRKLNGLEQFLWLAAVVLLPLIGFLIYWVAKFLARLLLNEPVQDEDPRLRVTAARPIPGLQNQPPPMPGPAANANIPPPAAGLQAGLSLAVTEGPYRGGRFLLTQLPARIGRGTWANVQLDADQGVSRQHAEIYLDPGGALHIRDLGSTHGTYVNGARVTDARLKPGDQITLGLSNFLLSEHRGS